MTPSGIEPATFWFVAQYLNHCATAVFIVHSALNLFRNYWYLLRNIYNSNKETFHNQSWRSGNV
jgi:hypothetical protein